MSRYGYDSDRRHGERDFERNGRYGYDYQRYSGYQPDDRDYRDGFDDARREADWIGYPVLLKAAAGGGGRGMVIANNGDEAAAGFERASAEAVAAFGDGTMFMERFVPEARHVEVQLMGDGKGKVVHFGERDCSVQRRYQKLIEEAPCAAMSDALRAKLLADPYFKDVPSMQAAEGKTALLFHAKDDLPEIRREVFALVQRHPIHFSAIVRDKRRVLAYVRRRNETDSAYHYNPNELYDFMVRRLFKQRLHRHGAYRVCFARRGNADRTAALTEALQTTRQRFTAEKGIASEAPIEVVPTAPIRETALQAVDYFLWAVQRTFDKHEDRFLSLLWPQCGLIIDADDTREKGYGRYYTKQKPLTAAALKEAEGYRSESPR
jgi:hypothetical protein